MLKLKVSSLVRMIILLSLVMPVLVACGTQGDRDSDGLSDTYETEYASLGLNPDHANLILVPVIRPNMTREQVQPTLDMIIDFFSRVPNHNPDGITGISVIIYWGNPLPASESDAPEGIPSDYSQLRTLGMPAEIIGKGHGVLIGSATNGGGQTRSTDWSGASNNWCTIAHELGHQLGLEHEPRGTGIPSPLYTSIMNYDYACQFNGDPNAVHFSTGKFVSIHLDERNLNETLPASMTDLEFLTQPPYNFRLERVSDTSTNVDFNKNGRFGETGIVADINGGTALTARDHVNFAQTAGGFTLATFDNLLVAINSNLASPVDWGTYTSAGLSIDNPGGLQYQIYADGAVLGSPLPLAGAVNHVTGDPFALEAFGRLFVTFPTTEGYRVVSYTQNSTHNQLLQDQFFIDLHPHSHPVLIRITDPEEHLYVFDWDDATHMLSYREVTLDATGGINLGAVIPVNMGVGSSATPIQSNSPIGGTWDSKLQKISLVTTESDSDSVFQGRMKLIQLTNYLGTWYGESERWLHGNRENAPATLSRPTILFDDRPTAGPFGQYLIFSLYERNGSDATNMELNRLTIADTDIWTNQLIQNVWTTSRSAPSATLYRDDVAWGWRVNETFADVPNILQVFLRSSGATDSGITDFDDVTWISTHGLKESLQNVTR